MAWNSTANNRNGHNGRGSTDELLDQENQRMTENLAGKVNRLKNIAFDIEGDAKDSTHFLGGMQEDFEGSSGLLSGTMKRVNHMVGGSAKNNRRLMCYLVLLLVVVFIICYYLVSHYWTS